jgi:eukaryotic-like serine/threonine-protein kinase
MAVRVETHAEPIPGYKLIERLGGGGFGEVWKCEAPGGLHKAIKFVFGSLDFADDGGQRAEQELKALSRVKTVRHPYILSLERYDIIDGQLLIVMELADRNLWDRYKECRTQGLPGIPREELLSYMEESAEALDLMNSQYQLQHLDIKPQNIFLVHNHVKVADFGLVKDLEGSQASVTGGITPVYAAPETFDGKVSRFSDQYSLGIVYQELLTGHRPFSGTNVRQLIMQHLTAAPDLSPLPEPDRPIIARCLSKEPDDRFPTCREVVHSLRQGTAGCSHPDGWEQHHGKGGQDHESGSSPESEGSSPKANRTVVSPWPPATPGRDNSAEEVLTLRDGPGQKTPQGNTRRESQQAVPGKSDSQGGWAPQPEGPGSRADAPPKHAPDNSYPASLEMPEGAGRSLREPRRSKCDSSPTQCIRGPSQTAQGTARVPVSDEAEEVSGDGVLAPALIIGLGGLGCAVLQAFRTAAGERFGSLEAIEHLRTLLIDTDPEVLRVATAGSDSGQATAEGPFALTATDVLLTPLNRPSHYLKPRDGRVSIESWLEPRLLYRIPRDPLTTGVRALGRLAFCDNFRLIQKRLHMEVETLRDPERLQKTAEQMGLGIRSYRPRVYIIAGLMGGTGSGMFLDLAYAVRTLLRRLGYVRPDLSGVLLVPQINARDSRQGLTGRSAQGTPPTGAGARHSEGGARRAHATGREHGQQTRVISVGNAYAALAELYHYAGEGFQARYLDAEPAGDDPEPPFARTLILPVPEELPRNQTATREVIGQVARFLLDETCSPLARWAEKGRVGLPAPPRILAGQYFHTVGLYRASYPRRQTVRQVASRLLDTVVERWMSKDARGLEDEVQAWVAEQWRGQELAAEHFISRVQEAATKRLGKLPEMAFTQALESFLQRLGDTTGAGAAPSPGGRGFLGRARSAGLSNPLEPEDLAEILDRYQQLLGRPECPDDANVGGASGPPVGTLEQCLKEAASVTATEWSQRLAEMPVRLIEQPAFRLAGAEEAVRQVVASIERVLGTHEPLSRELSDKALAAFARLMHYLAQAKSGNGKRPGMTTEELLEQLRAYPKLRYQALVMHQVLGIYISLRGHLTDTLREINFCRIRLLELSQLLEAESVRSSSLDGGKENVATFLTTGQGQRTTDNRTRGGYDAGIEGPGRFLFPHNCPGLDEAVDRETEELSRAEPLRELDERLQKVIRKQFVALVQVCLAPAHTTRAVARALRATTEAFLEERLPGWDAAGLLMEQAGSNEQTADDLVGLYEEALPEPSRTAQARTIGGQSEVVILAVPPGENGDTLHELALHALPNISLVASRGQKEEVVLYREWSNIALTDLELLGPVGQEAYGQLLASENFPPHARQDVPFEQPQ